jgi:hypothetical protein
MRTAELISEYAFAAGTLERVELHLQVLIESRDPAVADPMRLEFFLRHCLKSLEGSNWPRRPIKARANRLVPWTARRSALARMQIGP